MGYRELRTTAVLLLNSSAFRQYGTDEKRALRAADKANYDFDLVPPEHLEVLSTVDPKTYKAAASEYEFAFDPAAGVIRDHGSTVATCALCGKGDSKGDGTNADLLRYDFYLQNVAGGTGLWVGRTCILRAGLRVQGAASQKKAAETLQSYFTRQLNWWAIQAFEAEYPDHRLIPEDQQNLAALAQMFYSWAYRIRTYEQRKIFGEKMLATHRAMKGAAKFYLRHGRLTEKKAAAWQEAKALIARYHKIVGKDDPISIGNAQRRIPSD